MIYYSKTKIKEHLEDTINIRLFFAAVERINSALRCIVICVKHPVRTAIEISGCFPESYHAARIGDCFDALTIGITRPDKIGIDAITQMYPVGTAPFCIAAGGAENDLRVIEIVCLIHSFEP